MRNKALEDGYEYNRQFDCIDNASFAAVAEARARGEAANTPEAIAQRRADWEQRVAEERARTAAAARDVPVPAPSRFVLRSVDVNTATESELSDVPSVGSAVAAQIVDERQKGRFKDWPDLVRRVVGLGAAQPAAFASISGLTVNGESLPGAPPDPVVASQIHARYQERRRP